MSRAAGVLHAVHAAVVGAPEQQGLRLLLVVVEPHAAVEVGHGQLDGSELCEAPVEERRDYAGADASDIENRRQQAI